MAGCFTTGLGRNVILQVAAAMLVVVCVTACVYAVEPASGVAAGEPAPVPFWVWPVSLFVVTFLLGIVAVPAGIGGGALYVPIVSSFFPFHLDYVRCAGLMIALSGALAAGPSLLRKGLADIRLALPVALMASAGAIVGAVVGLALPADVMQIALGGVILGIALLMAMSNHSEYPRVARPDRLSAALSICGIYDEPSDGHTVNWRVHRTPLGLAAFILVGFMAGMFGMGAGWANMPVLNLVMGAPLKLSVGTSVFLLSVPGSSAAWIYVNSGAALPVIVVPSVIGIMLGSKVGSMLLGGMKPKAIRYIVISLLFLAGIRSLLKGMGM